MASITTRAAKGTPLTHAEVDANFTNLNTDKAETAAPTFTGQVKVAAGTAAAPSVTITGDLNTGLFSPSADQLSVTTGGTERLRIDAAGQVEAVSLGTAAAPAWSFVSDPNTGIYSPGADQLALSTGGTGRLFVDASGRVGIGTGSPSEPLQVAGNIFANGGFVRTASAGVAAITARGFRQTIDGTEYLAIYHDNTGAVFNVNSTERARIDSSGRLLVGTSSNRPSRIGTNSFNSLLQIESDAEAAQSITRWAADSNSSRLHLQKGRGTGASPTIVAADDNLGDFTFSGYDGANMTNGANIRAQVDGTPGTNDMPARLVFSTTADGASSATEQLRISNGGTVIYNQPAPAAVDTTATLTVANLTAKIITSSTAAAVTMTLPTGTLMDGGFFGLYNNMAFEWSVINTGATNAVTVQGGAGHTVVGSGTVAANNSQRPHGPPTV
jgi:hypothetical protein